MVDPITLSMSFGRHEFHLNEERIRQQGTFCWLRDTHWPLQVLVGHSHTKAFTCSFLFILFSTHLPKKLNNPTMCSHCDNIWGPITCVWTFQLPEYNMPSYLAGFNGHYIISYNTEMYINSIFWEIKFKKEILGKA